MLPTFITKGKKYSNEFKNRTVGMRMLFVTFRILLCSVFLTGVMGGQVAAEDGRDVRAELVELVNSARSLTGQGNYSQAVEVLRKALSLLDDSDFSQNANRAFLFNEISILERSMQRFEHALQAGLEAEQIATSIGLPVELRATYRINLGQTFQILGRPSEAARQFDSALSATNENQLEQPGLKASALSNLGAAMLELGQYQSSIDYLDQFESLASLSDLSISDRRNAFLMKAKAFLLLRNVAAARDAWTTSSHLASQTTTVKSSLSLSLETALVEARILMREGAFSKAREILAEISMVGGQHPSLLSIRASAHYNLAEIALMQGDYAGADRENRQAELFYAQILPPTNPIFAQITHRYAIILQKAHEFEQSLALYDSAIDRISLSLGGAHPIYRTTVLERARLLSELGHPQAALRELKELLAAKDEGQDHSYLDLLLVSAIGLIHHEIGENGAAFPYLNVAAEKWLSGKYGIIDAPPSLNALAEVELSDGRTNLARKYASAALEIQTRMAAGSVDRLGESRRILADTEAAEDNHSSALALASQNVDAIEERNKRIALAWELEREFSPKEARRQLGQYLELVWNNASETLPRSKQRDEVLFRAMQILHQNETASALNRSMSIPDAVGAELFEMRRKLTAELVGLRTEMQDVQRALGFDTSSYNTLRAKVAEIEKKLVDLDADIKSRFPDLAQYLAPEIITIRQLQSTLRSNEALWIQTTFEFGSFVAFVTQSEVEIRHIPIGTDRLQDLVDSVRATLDFKKKAGLVPFAAVSSHRLYELFFGDFLDGNAHLERLVLVPDQSMQNISLATLVIGRKDARKIISDGHETELRYLGLEFPIILSPSPETLYRMCRSPPVSKRPDRSVGFGDPNLQGDGRPLSLGRTRALDGVSGLARPNVLRNAFEPLPESRLELEGMARVAGNSTFDLFFGEEARESRIKELDLDRLDALVFATHALVSGDFSDVREPGLILTPPETATRNDDGLLLASEISQMRIDADIVILSACNTAAPAGTYGAPGLSGLARSFFRAGAKGLLVSHWTIASVSSVLITPKFFEYWVDTTDLNASDALRNAMRDLATNDELEFYGHPAIWGPFSVVGAY